MTCFKPLKGFAIGYTKNGKIDYKITGYNVKYIEFQNNIWYPKYENDLPSAFAEKTVREFIEIPCGQCIGCRLQRSREWADRCLMEMLTTSDKIYCDTWFVTLTYDDKNLPSEEYIVPDTGEQLFLHSLCKEDLQKFIKDLREAFATKEKNRLSLLGLDPERQKIRYFACGEYGTLSGRPHYHLIIFGLAIDDLKFYKMSDVGYPYYNSEWLSGIWKKGHVVVAQAAWENCAYVARYVTKKITGEKAKEIYFDFHLQPEFSLMSLKPGIGYEYLEKYGISDWFQVEKHFCQSHEIGNPRYFKKKLESVDPELFEKVKKVHQEAAIATNLVKMQQTSNSYLQMLAVEEKVFKSRIDSLIRKEV